MRPAIYFCIFMALSAIAFSQSADTNFSTGPQYLMNSSAPDLLRPIATPSLSLSSPVVTAPTASAEEGSGEPHSPAFPDLQTQAQIDRIYWGVPNVANSQSAAGTEGASPASETSTLSPESNPRPSSVIELSSSQPLQPLPDHFLEVGVTSLADADSLRAHGYGMPLGDVAAIQKANKRPAARVYTNADINRLHGG